VNRRSDLGARLLVAPRTAIVEALRWRLGFYDTSMLPAFPSDGLRRGAMLVRPYTATDATEYDALLTSSSGDIALLGRRETDAQAWAGEIARHFRAHLSPYQLAITFTKDGVESLAGAFYLTRRPDPGFTVEFGIALMPEIVNRGIGPRAAILLMDWLMTTGVHRIEIRHAGENRTACRAASGIGLAQEGVLRSALPVEVQEKTRWKDTCVHAKVNSNDARFEDEP
jgi:RimJ/RimL family protein N-acetyltransferase